MQGQRIAIIGGGPIGLEAALEGCRLGHDVRLYEAGEIGASVARWGFVRLFSPFGMNISQAGRERLVATGTTLPPDDAYLTGDEFLEHYLHPLAALPELAGRIDTGRRVRAIGRRRFGKGLPLGEARRSEPLQLLLDDDRYAFFDVVLDCSGSYGNGRAFGPGNLPALGEDRHPAIERVLPDLLGRARERYAGRRVALIGSGMSAATALDALLQIEVAAVEWISRNPAPPYAPIEDDPLPERARLCALGNALAAGDDPRVRFHGDRAVERVEPGKLTLDDGVELEAERILSLVGYEPDRSLYRELQLHECYASFGPMKLAATLLADDGGGNCLAVPETGPEALETPEPGFFVLGAKSYGTNPAFLMRNGLKQVRDAYRLIQSSQLKKVSP